MKKGRYYIGVDFGTTNTYVVIYDRIKNKFYDTATLSYNDITNTSNNIPTVIAPDATIKSKTPEISFYIGNQVYCHPFLQFFRNLKNSARMTKPDVIPRVLKFPFDACDRQSILDFGNAEYSMSASAHDLLIKFFKEVLLIGKKITKEEDSGVLSKDTVAKIVVGAPVKRKLDNGEEHTYEEVLTELVCEAFTGEKDDVFKKKIEISCEPELAGITYLYSDEDRDGKNVLVIDVGGGTSDFSVLKYENGGVIANNIGTCNVAGNSIDDFIVSLLPDCIPHYRTRCKEWKEMLFENKKSADTGYGDENNNYFLCNSNTYGSSFPNRIDIENGKLFVDGCEERDKGRLEDVIFAKIGNALRAAIQRWKNGNVGATIDKVFFVGGTTNIESLREYLMLIAVEVMDGRDCQVVNMFNKDLYLKIDSGDRIKLSCYNAVAIGAAIKAMGTKYLRVKPRVDIISDFAGNFDPGRINGGKSDLIMGKNSDLPIAYLYYDKGLVDYFINDLDDFEDRTITLKSYEDRTITLKSDCDKTEKTFKISKDELKKATEGLLIYAVYTAEGIVVYKACECTKDLTKVSREEVSDRELFGYIQSSIKNKRVVKLTAVD